MFAIGTLSCAGLASCSSDNSAVDGGAGGGADGAASGADGGHGDATTAADVANGTDSGTPGTDAPASSDGGTPGIDAMEAGTDTVDAGAPPDTAPTLCRVTKPTAPTIVDFTPRPNSATDGYSWGDFSTNFSGYTYFYNTAYLMSDVTTGAWRIFGSVADYSAFALGFACMTDASAYSGIQFTIKGNAGTPSKLTFTVSTAADDIPDPSNPSYARCVPVANPYDGTCAEPSASIDVLPGVATVSLRWSDLMGGRPSAVNPMEITGFRWIFAWPVPATDSASNAYPVDVTIDNIAFISSSPGDAASIDGSRADGSGDASPLEASTDGTVADAPTPLDGSAE